jgi:spermidine synthase
MPHRPTQDPSMSDPAAPQHAKPSLCRTATTLSLHFSWHETQSCMDVREPDALNLEYTRTMMGFLVFVPEPANIAMVGLGGGSLAKFCHRHLPTTRMQVIEINPHVIALRTEFQVPPDDERLSVILGDGAEFIRSPPERFDVLLIDGYDDKGLPPGLSTQRFYDDCRDMLTPGGILVVNLHCGHRHWQRQVGRIRHSFNGSIVVVEDDDESNIVVFAGSKHLFALPRARRPARPPALGKDARDALQDTFSRVLAAADGKAP